jgi:hypothetical protein
MSAAKSDEWPQAEKWFLEAQSAARLAQDDDMRVMAVGLGADAAVAALEIGEVGRALTQLAEAVEALAGVNPETSLRAAYCHRVIRHTVLWAQSRIERSDVKIGGKPIGMEAGTCSNPDPLPAIRELPLGHIDLAWYMLAEAETAARVDVGIASGLGNRLTQGPIPFMECGLRARKMQAYIDNLDAGRFAAHLKAFAEGAAYMIKEAGRLKNNFDLLAPERGQVPVLAMSAPFDPVTEHVASDAILAYAIHSVLVDRRGAVLELEAALESAFATDFPGSLVFDHWNGSPTSLEQLDKTVIDVVKALLRSDHVEPYDFWMAALRLFERINQSNFKSLLLPHLARWLRAGWKRIAAAESFRLSRPRQTVPAIEAVLAMPGDDRRFVVTLLLASSEAVGSPLGVAYRDSLRAMAEEEEPPSNTP